MAVIFVILYIDYFFLWDGVNCVVVLDVVCFCLGDQLFVMKFCLHHVPVRIDDSEDVCFIFFISLIGELE